MKKEIIGIYKNYRYK